MIQFPSGGILIQPGDSMPPVPERIGELYLDCETTSRDIAKKSVNPWHDCWPLGYALTWDDHPHAYYIPVGTQQGFWGKGNIDEDFVNTWLQWLFDRVEKWINHNIKYDFHVVTQKAGVTINCPIVCTLATAKLVDSDRQFRGGYGLDILSLDWLNNDIGRFEQAMYPYLAGAKNKDYGRVPVDLMAEYACVDTLANRPLWKYIDSNIPAESRGVLETEIEVTRLLADMEATGMRVIPEELSAYAIILNQDLIELWEKIRGVIGYDMNPDSTKDCYTLLCVKYGLPVIKWTNEDDEEKESNPSFGKDVLEKYKAFAIPDELREVLNWILSYRKKSKLLGNFVAPYRTLHIDGIIHPTYNQVVRTGRLSCGKPNMQQADKAAKALFKPREGNALFVIDYSQIEYRLIIHYINDQKTIQAYKENPRIDFHDWMAQLIASIVEIGRGPAKTMNFLIGFGGGKKKTKERLMEVDGIIELAQRRVREEIEAGRLQEAMAMRAYSMIVEEVALLAYNSYHANLPTLKPTSKKVEMVARSRIDWAQDFPMGYVTNMYGRRRHMPTNRCHIGFNSICQSTAADLIKERMVALRKELIGTPLKIVLQVHDSLGVEGPVEMIRDPRTINDITWIMENPTIADKLRVPIKANAGISEISWLDTDKDENDCTVDPVPPVGGVPFAHLKG